MNVIRTLVGFFLGMAVFAAGSHMGIIGGIIGFIAGIGILFAAATGKIGLPSKNLESKDFPTSF